MLRGLALIALAAIAWGTTGSVSTILAERADAGPLLVGLARMWVAALALVAGSSLARLVVPPMSRAPSPDARGSSPRPDLDTAIARQDRARCVLMGVCMAGYQATFFTAVPLAGIAVVALVAICSAPLMIAALAAALLGERIGPRVGVALALGILGATLLMLGPRPVVATPGGFVTGVLLALGAGASYALYAVTAKASVVRSAPLPLAAATFTIAALLLTPVLLWIDAPGRQVALGWPWLLYLGAVATGASYLMYTTGLRSVPASVAGIVTLLEPVTATFLGVIVFGERLGMLGAAGAALMLSALAVLAVPSRA